MYYGRECPILFSKAEQQPASMNQSTNDKTQGISENGIVETAEPGTSLDSGESPCCPLQQAGEKCQRHLLSMIHKASRQIEVFLDNVFQPEGLSAREAHILGYVTAYGPCSVSELVRVFGLKASTLTSMLDRLERQGYLHRKTNPEDRRSLLLCISEKGKDKACHAYDITDKLGTEILSRLTPEEIAGFEATMSAIDKVTDIKLR